MALWMDVKNSNLNKKTMDYRTLLLKLNAINLALLLVLPAGIAFRSIMQVHFRAEQEWANATPPSLQFVGRLEQGMSRSEYESILQLINSIEGVRSTQLELTIPEWRGDRGLQDQWNELWNEYASPMVFIQPVNANLSATDSARLAESIRGVSGVIDLAASRGSSSIGISAEQTERKQQSLSVFYFFLLSFLCAGLILNYPLRFRRQFAVQTGVGGIGSQINPETLWARMTALHAGGAMALYLLLFLVGYVMFPFTLLEGGSPSILALILEGLFMTGAITTGVCLIGWWLPAPELDAVRVLRPTMFE